MSLMKPIVSNDIFVAMIVFSQINSQLQISQDFSIFDLQCPAEERLVDNTSVNPMSSTIVYAASLASDIYGCGEYN